jgi:hypothetical protein
MPEERYPSTEEFWKRLTKRGAEPDLQEALRARAARTSGPVHRLGNPDTVIAFVERLLPGSAVPAAAIAGFLDENFDRPMGRADEKAGLLPRNELFPLGFARLDEVSGGSFAVLEPGAQDSVLARVEKGEFTRPERFDFAFWFQRIRDLTLLAFGSDPRGMVQMGYPGPSYKPGHVWLGYGEIAARVGRKPGYLEL